MSKPDQGGRWIGERLASAIASDARYEEAVSTSGREPLFAPPPEQWHICSDFLDPLASYLEEHLLRLTWLPDEGDHHVPCYGIEEFYDALKRLFPDPEWIFESRLYRRSDDEPQPFQTEFALTWLSIHVSEGFSRRISTALNELSTFLRNFIEWDKTQEEQAGPMAEPSKLEPLVAGAIEELVGKRPDHSVKLGWKDYDALHRWQEKRHRRMAAAESMVASIIRLLRHSSVILQAKFENRPVRLADTESAARAEFKLQVLSKLSKNERKILECLWPVSGAVGSASYRDLALAVGGKKASDDKIRSALYRLQAKLEAVKLSSFLRFEYGKGTATLTLQRSHQPSERGERN